MEILKVMMKKIMNIIIPNVKIKHAIKLNIPGPIYGEGAIIYDLGFAFS